MMESVPQEVMALILPVGGTVFLGVVTLFTVLVLLLKNKGVRPWVGMACCGLPIWGLAFFASAPAFSVWP